MYFRIEGADNDQVGQSIRTGCSTCSRRHPDILEANCAGHPAQERRRLQRASCFVRDSAWLSESGMKQARLLYLTVEWRVEEKLSPAPARGHATACKDCNPLLACIITCAGKGKGAPSMRFTMNHTTRALTRPSRPGKKEVTEYLGV